LAIGKGVRARPYEARCDALQCLRLARPGVAALCLAQSPAGAREALIALQPTVLIVGAGPSGLVLANILAAAGVEFRIIDKKTGPGRESRAAIIHFRSLELLDKLNIADPVVHQGIKTNRVEVYSLGRPSAEFALVPNRYQSRTPFPYALLLGQHRTEELLVDGRVHRTVEWEHELIALP